MKFGDTLTQRSVPAWRTYNIDYASIKRFIKDSTTPGKGKAVSIPGCGNELNRQCEDELFVLFQAECTRVSLFVRSKRYELDSRLGSIERQLDQATRRSGILTSDVNPQKALRLRQRYSKIESDILSVGEEIQKLSRFTAINRTAVRKLLKKQRKWSGNTTLGPRVEDEVLHKPDCFSETQLQPCLERYAVFLEQVRLPFNGGEQGLQLDGIAQTADSARGLSGQLNMSPKAAGPNGESQSQRRSIFWIHRDNVTEFKILLLQHMRAPRRPSTDSGVSVDQSSSPFATRRSSRRASTTGIGKDVSIIMADGIQQSNSAASTTRDGLPWPEYASHGVSFRWERCNADEYKSHLCRTSPSSTLRKPSQYTGARLEPCFEACTEDSIAWEGDSDDDGWEWLRDASTGPPIAQTSWISTNYEGLGNAHGCGSWAWLKENIEFSKLRPDVQLEEARSHSILDKLPKKNVQSFPHAVFEMTWMGEVADQLVSTLRSSHLVCRVLIYRTGIQNTLYGPVANKYQTERVDDFSLDVHAVATLFPANSLQPPTWVCWSP